MTKHCHILLQDDDVDYCKKHHIRISPLAAELFSERIKELRRKIDS
ncbi:MAG: hypothetical protein K9W44_16225 [Candidatus Lokiarchaeota archaeon]|nr:hypothetical protein [Candidatus Harpocratesius repetitus]